MSDKERKKENTAEPASEILIYPNTTEFRMNSMRRIASALTMKTPSNMVILATQLGISFALSKLATVPERDILMEDFMEIIIYYFPCSGSGINKTPPHKFGDFRFKDYGPVAFRYFRKFFGIQIDDFIRSLCEKPMVELSRSGSSGSLLFKTDDDLYVVKTVSQREAEFLQGLLPGYYMNLEQNKSTLLPKFFALYFYSTLALKFRFVIMNNLLPSHIDLQETYDIKGSTFRRKATRKELDKVCPTLKDLDLIERHPNGFIMDPFHHNLILNTLERDVRVLTSFQIMDYSLLIGVHNVTEHKPNECLCGSINTSHFDSLVYKRNENLSNVMRGLVSKDDVGRTTNYQGGIPAESKSGQKLLLFIGIIDILQNYRLSKKIEHGFKSFIHDGKTISVNSPRFYQRRFLNFCRNQVFTISDINKPRLDQRTTNPHDNMSDMQLTQTLKPPPILEITLYGSPHRDQAGVKTNVINDEDDKLDDINTVSNSPSENLSIDRSI